MLRQLANFTKQQGGVFDLGIGEAAVATDTHDDVGEDEVDRVDEDVGKDGDALDFMDEEELIEDEGGLDEMMEAELRTMTTMRRRRPCTSPRTIRG